MKIGELAVATATSVEAIRFYEREGLIPAPGRTASNYRSYEDTHVQRLAFIRRCRSLDMALEEIRELLRFKDMPSEDCGDVNALLDAHIRHVAERLLELQALEQELLALRARCPSSEAGANCAILQELSHAKPSDEGRARRSGVAHIGAVHAGQPRLRAR
jgi:Cd(II)/Pb(II)-responsive transcriptional regulator